MPFGEVKLIPGINVERTPTLLEAGFSQSQLIRFKDSLAQKYGGWAKYYNFSLSGVPRDLHPWQDLNTVKRLLIGTTRQLVIIDTSMNFTDITPQQTTTNPAVNFTTTKDSDVVEITDPDISNVTTFCTIMLNTPVAIGGLVLSGPYQIILSTGTNSYKIQASSNATSGVSNAGAVPVFTTISGSASVNVLIVSHGRSVGDTVVFQATTTGNGVTIFKHYTIATIADADNFTITSLTQATASGSFSMNGGVAQIVYNIAIGPAPLGEGYGLGGYGLGGYGLGDTGSSVLTGTPITATDWTSDNWGEIALACPTGGGVYQFDTNAGFLNASIIATAPPFNGGIFVSTTLQILFCWGSTAVQGIGVEQDPMLISWSDQGDYTVFTPLTTNQAGSFRIPIGSVIRGGMAVSNQNLFWTDLDLWAANYAGFPLVFGFNKIGAGAGAISSHSMQQLRNAVYWMGPSNFYSYSGEGVKVIPCPVWDAVFQNLNTAFGANVRSMPNTGFNEAGWLYPSTASANGECDSYVKMNITEPGMPWDYGSLPRSAWVDNSILGSPVGATPTGVIYYQETTPDADGSAISSSFTTGYFYIAEGEDFCFVDQIIPDMKWGTYSGSSGANVAITINAIDWPGDTPTSYGPYTMTSTTQYITTRIRARQMSVTVSSIDTGSFWRLGKIRYRFNPTGRR
jgi:hypothetical protein